jgi:RNA polymerase sigma-70 factor (ECF subfamily)
MATSPTAPAEWRIKLFERTQWSDVLAAGRSNDPAAAAALARLCTSYWPPLYAYVRRRGYPVQEAQDLTQEFFARLIEKRFFRQARRERGRFRAFLIVALKHFLANEWDRSQAEKRGGGAVIGFDFDAAEPSMRAGEESNPEVLFERQWVERILAKALRRVKDQYVEAGQEGTFETLKVVLGGGGRGENAYEQLAGTLGLTGGALRVAVHRLRQRYRAALRATVGSTVGSPADIDDEIRYLLAVLAG